MLENDYTKGNIKAVKNNVSSLMERLDFPINAQKVFLDALDYIYDNKPSWDSLCNLIMQYEETEHCGYHQMLSDMNKLGEAVGIHKYTSEMLLFLCLAEKLKKRYAERGIDESIFYHSLTDLRYKLEECRLVHGIVGSFVADWFLGFFNLTIFGLGRLQFEIVTIDREFTVSGITLPAGCKALNIHIPRTGTKLDHEQVLSSYQLAAEMFADEFKNQPLVFTCSSWLLDPWIITVLPSDSNLAAFYNDFHILSTHKNNYSDMWRLFDCLYTGDVSALPRNTSLRRAYAERMERGEILEWGHGVFIYRDGKIYNT